MCRTSDQPFDDSASSGIPTVSYELPDGQVGTRRRDRGEMIALPSVDPCRSPPLHPPWQEIHVGADRFKVPEMFFQPNLLSAYPGVKLTAKAALEPLPGTDHSVRGGQGRLTPLPRACPGALFSLDEDLLSFVCLAPPPPALVLDAIGGCDVDLRKELQAGVVLTGGSSLLPGLRDRLEKDLIHSNPMAKIKVSMPINMLERRFSVWIGE